MLLQWQNDIILADYYSIIDYKCIYIYKTSNFFNSSFINGHLDCFYTLSIINSALMNMKMHLSKLLFSFSLYKCTKAELWENMVLLSLIFWGASKLLSIVAAPIYSLTNSSHESSLYSTTLPKCIISCLFFLIIAIVTDLKWDVTQN